MLSAWELFFLFSFNDRAFLNKLIKIQNPNSIQTFLAKYQFHSRCIILLFISPIPAPSDKPNDTDIILGQWTMFLNLIRMRVLIKYIVGYMPVAVLLKLYFT